MSRKIFVGGLNWSTTEATLQSIFERFGAIQTVKIVADQNTGRSKGYAFITFEDDMAAQVAMSQMSGTQIEGRVVRVNHAFERSEEQRPSETPKPRQQKNRFKQEKRNYDAPQDYNQSNPDYNQQNFDDTQPPPSSIMTDFEEPGMYDSHFQNQYQENRSANIDYDQEQPNFNSHNDMYGYGNQSFRQGYGGQQSNDQHDHNRHNQNRPHRGNQRNERGGNFQDRGFRQNKPGSNQDRQPEPQNDSRIYVGGMDWNTTEETIESAFNEFGDIEEIKIVFDKDTGQSKGFGFVTFCDPVSAENAIEKMNGAEIDGRTIKVNKAQYRNNNRNSRPKRYNSGGSY